MARQESEILDCALLANHRLQHHDSLNARASRQRGICGLNFVNQISLADVGAAQRMRDRNERSRRQNGARATLKQARRPMRISASNCSRNIETKSSLHARRSIIAGRVHIYREG